MLAHSVYETRTSMVLVWQASVAIQSGAPISSSSKNTCSAWQATSPNLPVPKSHQGRQLP